MKTGIRPFRDGANQTMIERIDMDVIDVMSEVAFIADRMFPITALPHIVFTAKITNSRHSLADQCAGKPRLDRLPARGEIRVIQRQGPHRMQMIRQDHHGIDNKR